MAKELKALGEFIVLRMLNDTVTRGGILLPESRKAEAPGVAEVVSVGPAVQHLVRDALKVGSRVQFDTYNVTDLGDGLLAMKADNLLVVETETFDAKKFEDENGGVWVEDATSPTFARKVA